MDRISYISDSEKTEEKELKVYLPYNYDESQRYNILYLLHGTDKQEVDHINTWFDRVKIKDVLDTKEGRCLQSIVFDGSPVLPCFTAVVGAGE